MKRATKSFLVVVGVLCFGLIVGLVILLMTAPGNGPVFYDMAAPQLGIAVDNNRVVVEVLSGSPAEKVGMQRGDVLEKVGKQNITATSDVRKICQDEINSATGQTTGSNGVETMKLQALPVVVSRGVGQITLSLTPASPPFNTASFSKNSGPLPTPTPAPSGLYYL